MFLKNLFDKLKDKINQSADQNTEIPDEKTREQFLQNLQKAYEKYTEEKLAAAKDDRVETVSYHNISFTIRNGTVLTDVMCPEGTSTMTVPDGITEIASGVFQQMQEIKAVILPKGLQKIGDRAFLMCTALEEIILPQTVTHIGNSAFRDCQSLKSISIPVGIQDIGSNSLKCMGKVFLYSDKGAAQIYPYCEGDKRTDDIIARIQLMKKGNYENPNLLNGSGPMHPCDAFEEALKLASSYYIITEDQTALDFICKNMEDLILSIQDNTDILLKKLISKNLIATETLIRFVKLILRNQKSKSDPKFRVLCVILEYMKKQHIGLCEFSQLELVKYIRFLCPVPWEKVYFRIVAENDTLRFHYCFIEKDTGFITAMSTEERRYGYILDYRRPADIGEILNDRCHTFYALCKEKNSGTLWKAATFIVESGGTFHTEFEYEKVLSDDAWENEYTGGISQDFSAEYPVQKLQEESDKDLGIVPIPTDPQTRKTMTVQNYYALFQNACEYLGEDHMTMKPPAAPEQIERYKKRFSAEPDKAFMEWLSLCNGLTLNDWTIYNINSCVRRDRRVGPAYSHIADNHCCGYGISYETGKCWIFDHDFGDKECDFTDILDSILDAVGDCISEVEDEKEQAYLIKNGRALSDSYAAFLVKCSGADSIKSNAENARLRQKEEREKHSFSDYEDIEIVRAYRDYIRKVCGGKDLL